MLASELMARVAERHAHLHPHECDKVVRIILEEITAALERGARVELRGFGAFKLKQREARKGRNPRSGAPVMVEARTVVHFKAGKEMRKRLNPPR